MTIFDPSPETTIFSYTVSIRQTHTVIIPKSSNEPSAPVDVDDPSNERKTTTFQIPVIAVGERPDKGRSLPDMSNKAIWRVVGAGGTDEGSFHSEALGRLPEDGNLRPTTLEG